MEVDNNKSKGLKYAPLLQWNEIKYKENVSQYLLTFFFKTFIMGELWFRTDNAKHKQVEFKK